MRPSTSRPKRDSLRPSANVLLKRIRELEEENRRLRQPQAVPTLPPPVKPTPYEPPTLIPKLRMKAKAAKKSCYDWLVSHVPEPKRSATSRIKRQILRLYDNTEPREFEIISSDLIINSDDEKQHYCTIKPMSRLPSSQTTKYNGKRWFCNYCWNWFAKEVSLNDHLEYCGNNEAVRTIFPQEVFTNFGNYYSI